MTVPADPAVRGLTGARGRAGCDQSRVDLTGWPLVVVHLGARSAHTGSAEVVHLLSEAIVRERRFALAIVGTTAAGAASLGRIAPPGWIRRRRPALAAWCSGVAYVVPESALRGPQRIDFAEASRLWGCPVRGFVDFAAAASWLDGMLAA